MCGIFSIQQSQEQIISPTTVLEEFEQTSYATLPCIPSESQRNVTLVDLEAPPASDATTTTEQANTGEQTLLLSGPKTADRNDNRKPSALIDDGRSELTPKEYQVLRLQKQLQDQSSNLENLSTQKLNFETTSRYLTLSAGFLAIASYQWIVPIVLAVAAAALQVVDFAGLDSKCSKTESACQQLKSIQKWWMESINPQDQKWELRRLVQETETAVVAAVL